MEGKKSWIKTILNIVIPIAVLGVIIMLLFMIRPEEEPPVEIDIRGGSPGEGLAVIENDNLILSMDRATTRFSITDKTTGTVWESNPANADSDPLAPTIDKKANLKSTLYITYGNINGIMTTYNNCAYSIEKGIFEIEEKKDSIVVNYTIGNTEKEYKIPLALPEKDFNAITKKMEKKASKQVKEYYRKTDINKLRAQDNKEELLASYPDLADMKLYILREGVAQHLKAAIEKYFWEAGYTEEQYQAHLSRYSTKKTEDIPLFNVTVEYKLVGRDLVVSVPLEKIEYKPDYPITNIEILPYFGAGSTEDEGFMVVPESGGAVINFNNGRYGQNAYYANVYGWDYATSRTSVVTETRNTFPMFGLSKNGASFLCMLEDGASYGNINADVSGRFDSYNHVYAGYSLVHYESYDVSGKSNAAFYVYEEELPKETLTQRYRFGDDDNYSDMAAEYRKYLLDRYPSLGSKKGDGMPTVVEVVGAIDKVQQTAGIPYKQPLELTTYEETVELADELKSLGMDDFSLKLTGEFNDGVKHYVLKDVDYVSRLGGKSDFKKMLEALKEKNIKVYLEGQTDFAYDSGLSDGYIGFRDAAKFVSREQCELYDYSLVWYGQEDYNDPYYLVTPEYNKECFDIFKEFTDDYGIGMALRNTGYLLNSDYNPKDKVTREQSKALSCEILSAASENGTIINEGNDYALEYADVVTSMDISNSNMAIIDYDIPFYEMAIHGLVDYTGVPINLSEDFEYELLKSAEFGAGLSFTFMKCAPERIQETMYYSYFGAAFDLWKEKAVGIYKRFKDDFDGLYNKRMIGHSVDENNVRITEYEDGTKVYVNYAYKDLESNGIKVPARDYVVKRGE
ncbi:MAG: hypothetical protein K6F44_06565 [Lachnospiraceae bacterium]|nr:hypothetical protein [Lachnospiraceae bacterium]